MNDATQPETKESRLLLSQVLEEEYVRLHGPLPADYPLTGSDQVRQAAIYALIHRVPGGRVALCLSGGGIRSATFGLGIIQGLAKLKLLEKLDCLSTVSGGGYIGSWLSAWIRNHPQGLAGVAEALRHKPQPQQDIEPSPITHLRMYSN